MHRLASALPATALLLAALSGCSPASIESPQASPEQTGSFTLDNCGFVQTIDAVPERIVTIKSTTTELVMALGLADRIVGAAFLDGPIDAELGDSDGIPIISDFLPSQEPVLELEPDLVFGGWESNFTGDGVGERSRLAELGILSYVAPSACKEAGYMPDPLTFSVVFDEIREAGRVLGASEAAEQLIADQQERLDQIVASDEGLTALWYSSGTDTPYVGAGKGAPQMLMTAAGLSNIFASVDDTWASVGWESIVDADPDVIVLVDASWNTAESKKTLLAENPATRNLSAVINERYLIIPFAGGEAGVRNVQTVASLVDQLSELN